MFRLNLLELLYRPVTLHLLHLLRLLTLRPPLLAPQVTEPRPLHLAVRSSTRPPGCTVQLALWIEY